MRLGDGRAALAALLLAACAPESSTAGALSPALAPALASLPEGSLGHIEVRRLEARPRITLVTRDGDPSPAVSVVFVTDLGPTLTTALAAVVERRLRDAGADAELRVDRDAFRVRALLPDASRAAPFFTALAAAASRPVAPGSPEIALATQRLASLRRNPLDAPELAAAAACTGALGVAPGDAVLDLATAAGVQQLDDARRSALHAGNIAVAAVGPAAFGPEVAKALERAGAFPPAAPPHAAEGWPAADTAGVYTAPGLSRHTARLTLAVRVPEPLAAAAAAERLGAPESPLVARLRLLPEPWRVAQVAGVARRNGGCVSLVLEGPAHAAPALVDPAALAAATARREVAAELSLGAGSAVAARQILTAADPREAASRAAWWSLAGAVPSAPLRWTAALGVPADRSLRPLSETAATDAAGDARFQAAIDRAVGSVAYAAAERRLGVERGQGELWVLLASPCGVAEEAAADAGLGALATLASVETRRRAETVTLEPWITSDALGVLAHAPLRDERETPADLARRVADAAARAFTATSPSPEGTADARAILLEHLEHGGGTPQASVFGVFAGTMAPEHPSYLEPAGLWPRIAGAGSEGLRLRAQVLAQGPLRVAVLANADPAQAVAAGDAIDRWLAPLAGPRTCRGGTTFPHPGRHEARLPEGAPLAQAFLGAPIPAPGSAQRELAELTAAALDGRAYEGAGSAGPPGGLLEAVLADADATASARIAGGSRAPALIVDVRAPEAALGPAVIQVKALLVRLATSVTEADLARAAAVLERREAEGRLDPRRRVADLWTGRRAGPWGGAARPGLGAWRAFLGAALAEASMVIVEARPQ